MAAALPYILAVVAAGASAYNTNKTQKEAAENQTAGLLDQQRLQRQADSRVNNEIERVDASNPEAERRAASDQFMAQLQRNRSEIAPGISGASRRYDTDVENQSQQSDSTANKIADLMARINAPGMQRQREGQQFSRLSSDIGGIARQSAGQDFLTQLRNRAIQPNPWIDALGQAAGGASSAYASRAKN